MVSKNTSSIVVYEPEIRQVARTIDNHYNLQVVAENTRDIVKYQECLLVSQREIGMANLRGLAQVADNQQVSIRLQGEANELLMGIGKCLGEGFEDVNYRLDNLADKADVIVDGIGIQSEILKAGFECVAGQLQKQQKTLIGIADMLRNPNETENNEFLREADAALRAGMKADDARERQANYADAIRLLDTVLANPKGQLNHVAWFQRGWLKWKHDKELKGAEEAFFQAARLSAKKGDALVPESYRHQAYMQYLLGNQVEARNSITKALTAAPTDTDTRYDAARYAATNCDTKNTVVLLELCIRERPSISISMFAETDFQKPETLAALVGLQTRLTAEARQNARAAIQEWADFADKIRDAEKQAGVELGLPTDLMNGAATFMAQVEKVDYVTALGLIATGKKNLTALKSALAKAINKAELQQRKKLFDARDAVGEAKENAFRNLEDMLDRLAEGHNNKRELTRADNPIPELVVAAKAHFANNATSSVTKTLRIFADAAVAYEKLETLQRTLSHAGDRFPTDAHELANDGGQSTRKELENWLASIATDRAEVYIEKIRRNTQAETEQRRQEAERKLAERTKMQTEKGATIGFFWGIIQASYFFLLSFVLLYRDSLNHNWFEKSLAFVFGFLLIGGAALGIGFIALIIGGYVGRKIGWPLEGEKTAGEMVGGICGVIGWLIGSIGVALHANITMYNFDELFGKHCLLFCIATFTLPIFTVGSCFLFCLAGKKIGGALAGGENNDPDGVK